MVTVEGVYETTELAAGEADQTVQGPVSSSVELLIRVRWRGAPTDDVRVEAETRHTIAELLTAATAVCNGPWEPGQPAYLERTATELRPTDTIGDCGLVSGDTIRFELYDVDTSALHVPEHAVSFDVLAGPQAGRSSVLAPGSYVCGRDVTAALSIADQTVSVRHLTITVADDMSTTITPFPDVANPVFVNGVAIADTAMIGPSDVVQFGATAIALRVFMTAIETGRDQLGQIPFNRTPHRPSVVTARELKPLASIPVRPEPRRFGVLTTLAPLASGLLLFAFSKQVQFLALTMLSPIALIGNYFEDRKSGRHRYAGDVAKFRERLIDRRAEIGAALLAERTERSAAAPDLADLARRASLHTYDLWARDRDDDEFLGVRLGLGLVPSMVKAPLEDAGDKELREEAMDAMRGHDLLPASPVSANLKDLGVLALCGAPADVAALGAALVVQAATLHSPEDLVIAVLEGEGGLMASWTKWLPHTRSSTSPIGGEHVVFDRRTAERTVRELIEVALWRTGMQDRADHRWPWVLVVVDDAAGIDAALCSQLFDLCPQAGISVLHLSASDARAPRQADGVVRCLPSGGGDLSTVWFTDPELPTQQFEPEPASAALIDRVALALAPLRDATAATATTAIPRTVPLLQLLGGTPTASGIAEEWLQEKPYALAAPIGMGPDGPLVLDLVEHGPHALIGGTSGAGKSELLQSIVASLIAHYPPNRLNFLFVDYKGGASSTVFNDVPHTVGYVTNLEASLAIRALTSLRAELNHRMRVMEGRAKDLAEMLEKYPDDAPPSLVIVVDEFATLVKEVPEFVVGIVDIAQRGRSLGIHLILATQRPSGSVNDNILANTNLRISLRMLDSSESTSVIGTPAAAEIPVPMKGRAFARLGPQNLVAFQSGFTGAPYMQVAGAVPLRCELFGKQPRFDPRRTTMSMTRTTGGTVTGRSPGSTTGGSRRTSSNGPLPAPAGPAVVAPMAPLAAATPPAPVVAPAAAPERTHLDVLLEAVRDALPDMPAPRRPWRDVLPELLTLDAVEAESVGRRLPPGLNGRNVVIAITDDPTAQDQYPAAIDLEEGGGLLIVGTGGAGKTTALRSLAVAAAKQAPADDLVIFAIDCASRSLRVLGDLPHCSAVATGDDLEAITRIIATLTTELDRRRGVLSDLRVQAETLSAYLQAGHSMPRVLLLVDGYQTLGPMLNGMTADQTGLHDWLADLLRIITDGRQVGIHTVLTADRRQSIPPLLISSIANRLVLRQADEGGYTDFSIPSIVAKGLDLPAGRAVRPDGLTLQVGVVGDQPDGASQGAAISAAAATMTGTIANELTTRPWPESVDPAELGTPQRPLRAVVGITDLFHDDIVVDLDFADMVVVGQPRSGRSTALRTIARSLVAGGTEVWTIGLVGAPGGAAVDIGGPGQHCGPKVADATALLEEMVVMAETYPDRPRVLVVDNVDRYDDAGLFDAAGRLQRTEVVRTVGSIELRNLNGYTMNPMLTELRHASRTLLLQPESVGEVYANFGVRPPLRPGLKMTPGRGVLFVDRRPVIIQIPLS